MYDSRSSVDRAFDALIGYEIRRLNHLPKERRVLSELLPPNDDVTIESIDGNIILRRSELQELAKIVPAEYHDKLRLPFINCAGWRWAGQSTESQETESRRSQFRRFLEGQMIRFTKRTSTENRCFYTNLKLRNSWRNSTVS